MRSKTVGHRFIKSGIASYQVNRNFTLKILSSKFICETLIYTHSAPKLNLNLCIPKNNKNTKLTNRC